MSETISKNQKMIGIALLAISVCLVLVIVGVALANSGVQPAAISDITGTPSATEDPALSAQDAKIQSLLAEVAKDNLYWYKIEALNSQDALEGFEMSDFTTEVFFSDVINSMTPDGRPSSHVELTTAEGFYIGPLILINENGEQDIFAVVIATPEGGKQFSTKWANAKLYTYENKDFRSSYKL